jgi:N-acetyltransferase
MVDITDVSLSFAQPKGGTQPRPKCGDLVQVKRTGVLEKLALVTDSGSGSEADDNSPLTAALATEQTRLIAAWSQSIPADALVPKHALVPKSKRSRAEALVGKRVSVYWNGDKKWYTGTVTRTDGTTGGHEIRYDDGEYSVETLKPLLYRLLDDALPMPAAGDAIAAAAAGDAMAETDGDGNLGGGAGGPQKTSWPIAWRDGASLEKPERESLKRKRSTSTVIATKKDDQYVLDVRKKGFAITCKVCGMLYNEGQKEDEGTHRDFHRRFEQLVKFSGWKDERVLERLDGQDRGGARVVAVHSEDKPAHLSKVAQVKQAMDTEMGIPVTGRSLMAASGDKAFMYISASGVAIGCAIIQRASTGFAVAVDAISQTQDGERDSVLCSEREPVPCSMGVRQMWVHPQHRRKSVMTTILDSARSNLNFGTTIPRTAVAFTQTTRDGRRFASKYFGGENFLVYEAVL